MPYRIALIPGDGIGLEVVPEAVRVLKELAGRYQFGVEFAEFPYSCNYFLKHGVMMPEDGIVQLRPFDAILLGTMGAPGVPDHVSLWGLLIPIRRRFDHRFPHSVMTSCQPDIIHGRAGAGPDNTTAVAAGDAFT